MLLPFPPPSHHFPLPEESEAWNTPCLALHTTLLFHSAYGYDGGGGGGGREEILVMEQICMGWSLISGALREGGGGEKGEKSVIVGGWGVRGRQMLPAAWGR